MRWIAHFPQLRLLALAGITLLTACENEGPACLAGSEACQCSAANTCNPGLSCASLRCVRIPAGQDGTGGSAGGGGASGGTGGSGGGGVSGVTGGTGNGGATGGTGGAESGGDALVKLCNSMRPGFEVTVGGVRTALPAYGCAPLVGQPCGGLPAGQTRITGHFNGQDVFLGAVTLAAGSTSVIVMPYDYTPVALTVASAAACSQTTYEKAVEAFPGNWPLNLEPFANDDVAFPKPRGWKLATQTDPNRFVFLPPGPDPSQLTEFLQENLGVVPNAGKAVDLVRQSIDRYGFALEGKIEGNDETATATARAPDGLFAQVMIRRRIKDAKTGDAYVHLSMLAGPSVDLLDRMRAKFFLENVVANVFSRGDVTASEVVGSWFTIGSLVGANYTDVTTGAWSGGSFTGEGLKLTLTGQGEYQFISTAHADCTGVAVCIVEGTAANFEKGRYAFSGGVLSLERVSCVTAFYDKANRLKESSVCQRGVTPAAVFLSRGAGGKLQISGTRLTPLTPTYQVLGLGN